MRETLSDLRPSRNGRAQLREVLVSARVAGKRMEEISARLREFRVRGHGVLPIAFSWGTAEAAGRVLREALDEADQSMYARKRAKQGLHP